MLPSTGIFKSIDCPFFDANADNCNRPYCHFRHVIKETDGLLNDEKTTPAIVEPKPQIQILLPPVVYKPTPKAVLDARKVGGSNSAESAPAATTSTVSTVSTASITSSSDEPEQKRRRVLEYVPKATASSEEEATPTYTPSAIVNEPLADNSTDGYAPEESTISGDENVKAAENKEIVEEATNGNKSLVNDSKPTDDGSKKESSSSSRHHKSSRSHSSSSSRSKKSSGDKHRSSTSSRSSRSSSKEPSKSGDKDSSIKPSSSSTKHSSHSSSSHRSSSNKSGSSGSKDKHSSSSSSKSRHRDRSKDKDSSSKSKHSSSSSSSRSKDHHRSDRKPSSSSSSSSKITQKKHDDDSIAADVAYELANVSFDEDEDDVEAQCRLIFAEYTPDEVTATAPAPSTAVSSSADVIDPIAEKYENSGINKKRVAYDNADRIDRPTQPKVTNHVQNAMQSVFKRQEVVRKQFELKEKAKAELVAKRQQEEEKAKALAIASSSTVAAPKLTPLISPSITAAAHRLPTRPIAAVSNLLAIQRAKEKIEEMKAAKLRQQNYTAATTVAKGVSRVAHVSKAVETTPSRPAPPILEPTATKISHNIRSQYYNIMVKHCLTIYDSCEDAWERAQTEELAVFKKCSTPVIYKQSAALAINKLRKESLDAGNVNTEKNKTVSHDVILAGKNGPQCSWNVNKKPNHDAGPTNLIDTASGEKAYEMIAELQLTEEQLRENGYPRQGKKPGMANIFKPQTGVTHNDHDRYCRRCGKLYNLEHYDETCEDECNYHPKRPGFRRGFADSAHICCQQPAGSPGCMYGNYHVTDYLDYSNLTGFVKTIACPENYVPRRKDVYALDCEMCYTTIGLELTRVTVVDINKKVVYDALVKPDNRIVDYNTKFSGISEATLRNETRTLRDVQAVLLSMFNAKTVLLGHSLESDLKALKLIHDVVVDTSILFPHKMGPPKKRALKTLCIENLKRIIQEDDAGHNSAEDAEVCIDLVKHYLRNRIN